MSTTLLDPQPLPASAASPAEAYARQLSDDQLAIFEQQGYLMFPGWIAGSDLPALRAEIDGFVNSHGVVDPYAAAESAPVHAKTQMDLAQHFRLMAHPSLMALLTRLLGPGFAHHHLHNAKHTPGDQGVAWHHDYEQHPQTIRTLRMVHTFWYLNGLDGTIGDLLVIPGSHRSIFDRSALSSWKTAELPGTVRLNNLPPGSVVIVHSAALHARDPQSGGNPEKPRYFIDSSYCQAGPQWPQYGPWRDAHARALADGRAAAAGVEHLFDPRHFYNFDTVDWDTYSKLNVGSLINKLNKAP